MRSPAPSTQLRSSATRRPSGRGGALSAAGGDDDPLVDRQGHLGIGISGGHGEPSLGLKASESNSDYHPRFRQTQRDGPRLLLRSALGKPDLLGPPQTKPPCMACRRSGVRIHLAPPRSGASWIIQPVPLHARTATRTATSLRGRVRVSQFARSRDHFPAARLDGLSGGQAGVG